MVDDQQRAKRLSFVQQLQQALHTLGDQVSAGSGDHAQDLLDIIAALEPVSKPVGGESPASIYRTKSKHTEVLEPLLQTSGSVDLPDSPGADVVSRSTVAFTSVGRGEPAAEKPLRLRESSDIRPSAVHSRPRDLRANVATEDVHPTADTPPSSVPIETASSPVRSVPSSSGQQHGPHHESVAVEAHARLSDLFPAPLELGQPADRLDPPFALDLVRQAAEVESREQHTGEYRTDAFHADEYHADELPHREEQPQRPIPTTESHASARLDVALGPPFRPVSQSMADGSVDMSVPYLHGSITRTSPNELEAPPQWTPNDTPGLDPLKPNGAQVDALEAGVSQAGVSLADVMRPDVLNVSGEMPGFSSPFQPLPSPWNVGLPSSGNRISGDSTADFLNQPEDELTGLLESLVNDLRDISQRRTELLTEVITEMRDIFATGSDLEEIRAGLRHDQVRAKA